VSFTQHHLCLWNTAGEIDTKCAIRSVWQRTPGLLHEEGLLTLA